MGRKRTRDKNLPNYLYYRRSRPKRPYLLVRPDGHSESFGILEDALQQWAYWWGGRDSCFIGDLIDTFIVEIVPKHRERTRHDYIRHANKLRTVFREMDIRDLRPYHLIQYRDKRGEQSPHQANRELSVMSEICKIGIAKGLIHRNPCKEVSRLPEYARDVDVDWQAFEAVFNRATPRMQVAMMLVAITGMRPGEPRTMLRSAFGDDGLRYVESKSQRTASKRGGRKRHWRWSPMLRWCYERAVEIQGRSSVYLLPARHGGPYTSTNWSRQFKVGVLKALAEDAITEPFQMKDIRAMAANEADNPFELLQHGDGSITLRHYANRRARTTTPIR